MSDRVALLKAAMQAFARAHYALADANFRLKGRSYAEPEYALLLDLLDKAQLDLARAKWLYWRSTGEIADFAERTGSDEDVEAALALFADVEAQCALMIDADLPSAADAARAAMKAGLGVQAEIQTYHGVPIVPSICPIVVLAGSARDMGRQYCTQIMEIFGRFPFEALSRRVFTRPQSSIIARWREQLQEHTPDIVEFARGMSYGARSVGLPLTLEQALFIWTGDREPSRAPVMIGVEGAEVCGITGYFGGGDSADGSQVKDAADLCSGFAAWGEATRAEQLIVGCATDHDCTFQATIVAFPTDGHAFIYTPFSVNGSIPGVGRFFMAGHPGVNAAGLAYVHHGGPCGCTEPTDQWGYGVRRGASTFHNMLRSDNLDDALGFELSLPVGDDGRLLGAPGGFYADMFGAAVIESRVGAEHSDGPIVRRDTTDTSGRARKFLYANNNVQSREAEGLFCPPEGGYEFDPVVGWHTYDPARIYSGGLADMTRHMWAASSEPRNRYLHRVLSEAVGEIDFALAESVYRRGPQLDTTDWPATEARLAAGEKLDGSVGTRFNAQVALIEIRPDAAPRYCLSIGPIAHRSVCPHRVGHGFYFFDETNTYWTIELRDDVEDMVRAAMGEADLLIAQVREALETDIGRELAKIKRIERLVDLANACQAQAEREFRSAFDCAADLRQATFARSLRQATRAQIRARQVIEAVLAADLGVAAGGGAKPALH